MTLTPCRDVSRASWITENDLPWDQLVTFGPQVFAGYARLRFLPDPTIPGEREPTLGVEGPVEYPLLRTAVHVLAEHTRTPEDAYFCMWTGWGTPAPLHAMPKVVLPERSYFLFHGSLSDFGDWNSPGRAGLPPDFAVPPPAFIWPGDHAWCVALDVDPHFAGIGASTEAIAHLVAHPAMDVIGADPSEEQPFYR